jgi:hypothetical protein
MWRGHEFARFAGAMAFISVAKPDYDTLLVAG